MDINIENIPVGAAALPPPAAEPQQDPQDAMPPDPLPERDARLTGPSEVERARERQQEEPEPDISHDPRVALARKASERRRRQNVEDAMTTPGLGEYVSQFAQPGFAELPPEQQEAAPAPAAETVIRVLGQDIAMDSAEVARLGGVAEAQKSLAAEVRFRQAAELKANADETLAMAETRERAARELMDLHARQTASKVAPANPASPMPGSHLPADAGAAESGHAESDINSVVESIFTGDIDGAKKALARALKPATQDVRAVVDQTLRERETGEEERRRASAQQEQRQRAQESARAVNAHMSTHHAQLVSDPILMAAAQAQFALLRQSNPGADLVALAERAATTVEARIAPAPDPYDRRDAIKTGMFQAPNAGNPPIVPAARPQSSSRSAVVQSMRAARGLPVD